MAEEVNEEPNPKDLIGATKVPIWVVPPVSIMYEAQALANGASKYGAYNWREKRIHTSIYLSACMRHLLAYLDGEDNAPDSGIDHLAHAKATLGILLDAREGGMLIDDRPKVKGGGPQVLEKLRRKA